MSAAGASGYTESMWLLVLGAAATAVFWLLVFDLIERRKSR
jgi:hypothetical protein